MRTLLRILPLFLAAAAPAGAVAQPGAGSRLPSDLNTCILCHGIPEQWKEGQERLYLPTEKLAEDAHFRAGVGCSGCHGGNPASFDVDKAHSTEVDEDRPGAAPFRLPLSEVRTSCFGCHEDVVRGLAEGVHAEPEASDGKHRRTPPSCHRCHGEVKHHLVSVDDPRSPMFLDNQVERCGECHQESRATYEESVHGHGLRKSGLLVTASCADCHGAHAIHPASDDRSTLHAANVAGTCAQCHRFIEERLKKSVHGNGNGPGGAADEAAPGGETKRRPSCTDCHTGHDLPHPKSASFRMRLSGRCGNCHVELSHGYGQSLHGALTDLGYEPAAKCSDCHGAHDVLPLDDPRSRVAEGENRLATCKTCHPDAVPKFASFHPHADHHDFQRHPVLHVVYTAMELLILSVFAFFGVHTVLWFVRSLVHVSRHGRPQRLAAADAVYVRFEPIHRVTHAIVVVSFLGLALTGLPLKYSDQAWAQVLARALGGFESTNIWHRICAVLTIGYFATHVAWISRKALACLREGMDWRTVLFGPDSPVPGPRDFVDMYRMARWFVGLGPKPEFERWTYWEKFDYWAVFWGVAIIGTSGLMLWFPNLFCRFLPGEVLNLAKIIHSEEALLATSFIFAIHFFGTHLRPEKFPIDMAILAGAVSEEELREERPEFVERMDREGKLEELKTAAPSRAASLLLTAAGFVAVAVGMGLFVGIVLAIFGG